MSKWHKWESRKKAFKADHMRIIPTVDRRWCRWLDYQWRLCIYFKCCCWHINWVLGPLTSVFFQALTQHHSMPPKALVEEYNLNMELPTFCITRTKNDVPSQTNNPSMYDIWWVKDVFSSEAVDGHYLKMWWQRKRRTLYDLNSVSKWY